jgi:hypothetical protein
MFINYLGMMMFDTLVRGGEEEEEGEEMLVSSSKEIRYIDKHQLGISVAVIDMFMINA